MSQVSFQRRRRTGRVSTPVCRQPNSQWTPKSSYIDRGKISMGDCPSRRKSTMEHRGKSTMERNTASPAIESHQTASNGQRGKDPRTNCHGRCPSSERFTAKDAKKPKSDSNDSFQDPQPKQRRRVTVKDTNHVSGRQSHWLEWPSGTPTACRGTQPRAIS